MSERVIHAIVRLLEAAYLDNAPTDEQAEMWKEAASLARHEHDKAQAEIERLRARVKETEAERDAIWIRADPHGEPDDALREAIAAAVAQEREACAEIADRWAASEQRIIEIADEDDPEHAEMRAIVTTALNIRDAIRARAEPAEAPRCPICDSPAHDRDGCQLG